MIDNKYQLTKLLGKGGSSKVFLAQDSTGSPVAIKAIRKDKKYSSDTSASLLNREAEMLQKLEDHPNVIGCLGTNWEGLLTVGEQSENIMYNILEFASNGSFSKIIRYTGPIEEEVARLYVLQIWNAINHMHDLGFAHLDIKLENILLDEFFNSKIADLGSWIQADHRETRVDRRRGTLMYMAPEVYNLKEGEEYLPMPADIYSLGITIYVLLTGEFPTPKQVKSLYTCDSDIKTSCDMEFETDEKLKSKWDFLSKEVKILIQSMINPNPNLRPNISQVLGNSWINREFDGNIIEDVYWEMNSRQEFIVNN